MIVLWQLASLRLLSPFACHACRGRSECLAAASAALPCAAATRTIRSLLLLLPIVLCLPCRAFLRVLLLLLLPRDSHLLRLYDRCLSLFGSGQDDRGHPIEAPAIRQFVKARTLKGQEKSKGKHNGEKGKGDKGGFDTGKGKGKNVKGDRTRSPPVRRDDQRRRR